MTLSLDGELRTLTDFCKSMADEGRARLVLELANGPQNVGTLTRIVGKSQPMVSIDLARLRVLGLVKRERRGHEIFYSLAAITRHNGSKTLAFRAGQTVISISRK